MSRRDEKTELPDSWRQIQSAIWLIGLAIIAWRGWWWPGILVLVAISGLTQGAIRLYLSRTVEQQAIQQARVANLPQNCPSCGGPIDLAKIKWRDVNTAVCPFCGSTLKTTGTSKEKLST